MNINELKEQYMTTIAQANGESANEETLARDPDSWLMAREEGYAGGAEPKMAPIGGRDEAAAASAEQAAIAANQALAQLQAAKTEVEQLVIDLRARLAEMDDLESFAQNVNYYRQKQDELETLLAEVTATRAAAETAQTNATLMRSAANIALGDAAIHDASIAQSVEANEYAINQWRQELGNANNVYTGLEMLGLHQDVSFAEVLVAMATPSVGYFSIEFEGGREAVLALSLSDEEREFVSGMTYLMNLTVHKNQNGYEATLAWTAHDSNGAYSPMTYEDRTVMGNFDTGWVVRNYVPSPTVYGG